VLMQDARIASRAPVRLLARDGVVELEDIFGGLCGRLPRVDS
jgi:hypothetical protein